MYDNLCAMMQKAKSRMRYTGVVLLHVEDIEAFVTSLRRNFDKNKLILRLLIAPLRTSTFFQLT